MPLETAMAHDEDTVKPILAKLNDLARFFTKESIDTVLSIIPQKE